MCSTECYTVPASMKIYKTKWFHRWAAREGLADTMLHKAVSELEAGLADALGGYVYKKRIGLPGRGKRGGVRTPDCFPAGRAGFFHVWLPEE